MIGLRSRRATDVLPVQSIRDATITSETLFDNPASWTIGGVDSPPGLLHEPLEVTQPPVRVQFMRCR